MRQGETGATKGPGVVAGSDPTPRLPKCAPHPLGDRTPAPQTSANCPPRSHQKELTGLGFSPLLGLSAVSAALDHLDSQAVHSL